MAHCAPPRLARRLAAALREQVGEGAGRLPRAPRLPPVHCQGQELAAGAGGEHGEAAGPCAQPHRTCAAGPALVRGAGAHHRHGFLRAARGRAGHLCARPVSARQDEGRGRRADCGLLQRRRPGVAEVGAGVRVLLQDQEGPAAPGARLRQGEPLAQELHEEGLRRQALARRPVHTLPYIHSLPCPRLRCCIRRLAHCKAVTCRGSPEVRRRGRARRLQWPSSRSRPQSAFRPRSPRP
mmetsp:Transcript_1892/g.6748  ORF Transcript_1892/g.6748 Transcript_1892/m.6748 type:complete len:238 (-) Transcript_1892:582-1295(-)